MNDALLQLEAQKSELLRQLATVGDLRPRGPSPPLPASAVNPTATAPNAATPVMVQISD